MCRRIISEYGLKRGEVQSRVYAQIVVTVFVTYWSSVPSIVIFSPSLFFSLSLWFLVRVDFRLFCRAFTLPLSWLASVSYTYVHHGTISPGTWQHIKVNVKKEKRKYAIYDSRWAISYKNYSRLLLIYFNYFRIFDRLAVQIKDPFCAYMFQRKIISEWNDSS